MDFGLISVVIWPQLKKKMKLGVSYVVVECMNVKADENDALAFTNVASSLSGYETAKWSTKLAEIPTERKFSVFYKFFS